MTGAITAETAYGTLRGSVQPGAARPGPALFAGIPFAAPPVGDLRFRPPQPPAPWTGVRDATRFRPSPPQRTPALMAGTGDRGASAFGALAEGGGTAETSEDCLYLNVWTPDRTWAPDGGPGPAAPRPVIVWVYGGGFDSGSASPPSTDGAALCRQTGAIVVAANYRVGALGYLYLADAGGSWADSANLGLQDQAAALRWVRENIAAFGGDPGSITVAGESAGAFSIGALLAAPMAAGTFDKAILSSGSTSRVFDTTIASGIAADLLSALRLDDPDGLRTVPADRILDVQNDIVDHDIGRRNLPGGRSWGVVLDGAVLPRDPQQAVADGAVAHIPLLIGANRDETRVFQVITGDAFGPRDEESLLEEMRRAGVAGPDALLDAYRRRVPGAPLAELRASFLTDAVYRRPATQLAAAQAAAGGRAWSYLFAAEPAGPALGAFHGADLMFLFDKLALIGADTPDHRAAQEALLRAWADFAASGDPGWPAYDPGTAGSTGTTGSARAIGGPETMVTEPPADDVTARWDC